MQSYDNVFAASMNKLLNNQSRWFEGPWHVSYDVTLIFHVHDITSFKSL